eukprot:CAMPEP_0117027100 /NCGR_PEP_ID=MMETSP0472-20121206/19848_1 /TAXON_ID=693140 ORGANISM="Tiarina fusus, Strain LIS" /NCGR_SAMPLE_ID=MMETSP0472 /ASSEMBLY_ACC=CAM_ASM_000603 /LENGTH=313 /DNA_ID=CAMNT_0004734267 /DNA_START=74 /DNA_END=1015 /DNA_ORIENTATION=-
MAGDAPAPRPSLMEKQNSVTMEYFLETSNLDASTTELLRKYDKDGNGSFSKDEVVAIILDLRETMRANENLGHYNKLFKRLLIAACGFCVLLLAAMFGLSYAVAALTAKTEVDSTGALVATGSHNAVAVNSRAEIHVIPRTDEGYFCTTWDEIDLMRFEITNGRNVVLDRTGFDGAEDVTKLSGGAVTVDAEKTCFTTASGETQCAVFWPECEGKGTGRRLTAEDRRRLGMPQVSDRRRLQNEYSCYGCVLGGISDPTGCFSDDGAGTLTLVTGGPGDGVTTYNGCWCTQDSECAAGSTCEHAPEGFCEYPSY